MKHVLVLGTGLGSVMDVMQKRGANPDFTLVEKDKVVLQWAMELAGSSHRMRPVCDDARRFVANDDGRYDLVFVDVFSGRVVPSFVAGQEFLEGVKRLAGEHGRVAINYIPNSPVEWQRMQQQFQAIFPGGAIIGRRENRILVA